MLRGSWFKLEMNDFRCYETKIEDNEKAGSRRELNPGYVWLELPPGSHSATRRSQRKWAEWLPGEIQYHLCRIVRVGGCLAVVAQ